ncbi:MAG: SDR family oxidoreductase [Myxococcales bacterium]|nr:SDR family oxidoreductase [Myxococcales bacterium]MCB9531997.1 SDR family oxidoreductase [Myxococcales bacterium]MCB9533857.1 SDR family oxidoreductase [Myxococcales bacterium]
MEKRFAGKVAWITGGGSGIGRALAVELARNGADVAVSGRRADRLSEAVAACEAEGVRAIAVPCDVTQEDSVQAAVASVVAQLGRLDVAVANAGFGVSGAVVDVSADEWRRQLDTNVVGVAMTARHAVPELEKTRGRLVVVGSVSGTISVPGSGAYSASKYAVRSLAQTLSIELAPRGVSCTLIQPGFVESEIAKVDNRGEYKESRKDRRPAKLMWKADDAARVMVRAIDRRAREYTFTAHGKAAAFLGMHFPGLVHLALSRSGAKPRG